MIGPRIGVKIGPKIGAAIGLSADSIANNISMATVTKDATSGIYCPATAAEWTTTMAVAGIGSGGPSTLWLCQEATGNLADSIGSRAGVVTGTAAYQQAVTGWTRKGVKTTEGIAGRFTGTISDISTTSALVIAYIAVSVPGAAQRTIIQLSNGFANRVSAETNTTQKLVGESSANAATGTASPFDGTVRPYTVMENHTGARSVITSNQEKLVPTHGTPVGTSVILGGDNVVTWFPTTATCLYFAFFSGTAAELADAQLKKLLQTLGWSPAWT